MLVAEILRFSNPVAEKLSQVLQPRLSAHFIEKHAKLCKTLLSV